MKYIYIIISGLCIFSSEINANTNYMDQILLNFLIKDHSGLNYTQLPNDVETSLDTLFASSDGTGTNLNIAVFQPLVDFVIRECRSRKAWKSDRDAAAYGAGILTVFTNSMQDKLYLNYDPAISDCVLFPCSIRYSETPVNKQQVFDTIVRGPCVSNTWKNISYIYKEYNTPNQQSGATYTYTNRKTLYRASVGGNDTMISLSEMQGESSVSKRGVPIGPEGDFLYYYGDTEGLTLPGFFWMKSKIYKSRSAMIHVELASNMVACASISYLGAGWQGLNVTREFHIYEVLRTIIDYQHRLLSSPQATVTNIYSIVRSVDAMTEDAVNREYGKYCQYVEQHYLKGKGHIFSMESPTKLGRWYDKETLKTMPVQLRRTLVLQERIRQMLGSPTWSALPDIPAAKNEKKK